MASEVDIVNLALSRLGDSATVSSISPPEGSAQAQHAARFYPIARNSLLESHDWGFATRRIALALLTSASTVWAYAYAVPAGMLKAIAVLPGDATSDQDDAQDFVVETNDTGSEIIYTNQAGAVLRYTALVSDTTRFSPLFIDALSWTLAGNLAGPIIKGDSGRKTAMNCYGMAEQLLMKARVSDASQRHSVHQQPSPDWVAARA